MIAKEEKKEIQVLTKAVVAGLARSRRNRGFFHPLKLNLSLICAQQQKGKELGRFEVLVSIARIILCVC